jgi:hypothetical protein
MHPEQTAYPRLPLDLRQHRGSIAINISILVFFTSILPVCLYFILRYAADISLNTTFNIITPIVGVPALISFSQRTYRLIRYSDYRPLDCNGWYTFDYFHFNFLAGIVYVAVLFAVGNAENKANIRIIALFLPLVLFQLSGQLLLLRIMAASGLRTPFRISSFKRGSALPSGAVVVAEDVIAVDGNGKRIFRQAWQARLAASPVFASTVVHLDWMFGISGILCGGALVGIIFGVDNADVGFALGDYHSCPCSLFLPLLSMLKSEIMVLTRFFGYSLDGAHALGCPYGVCDYHLGQEDQKTGIANPQCSAKHQCRQRSHLDR